MEKKKVIGIVMATIIIILIVVSSVRFYYLKNNDEKYHTMKEVRDKIYTKYNYGEELNRSSFLVKDEVTLIKKINIPRYHIYENKTSEYYDVSFTTNASISLYLVSFKSLDGGYTYFSTDFKITFEKGEKIKFELPVNEYKNIYLSEGEYWKTIEPFFNRRIIFRYMEHITFNEIEITNITKDISVNNQTNSFHCNLTFNSISDFFPYPVKWKDVNLSMSEDYREEDLDDYSMKVYHENTYLGRLESDDPDLDKFIELGDRIEVSASNYTSSSEYVPIQLETSHPSNIEYEVSEFPITPRYDIYFEE